MEFILWFSIFSPAFVFFISFYINIMPTIEFAAYSYIATLKDKSNFPWTNIFILTMLIKYLSFICSSSFNFFLLSVLNFALYLVVNGYCGRCYKRDGCWFYSHSYWQGNFYGFSVCFGKKSNGVKGFKEYKKNFFSLIRNSIILLIGKYAWNAFKIHLRMCDMSILIVRSHVTSL